MSIENAVQSTWGGEGGKKHAMSMCLAGWNFAEILI